MGDRDRPQPHQLQVHSQHRPYDPKSTLAQRGPSPSKILAVVTLLPVGGTLLFLAGITLIGTLIGLAVATPVFLLFSPVIVPAALTLGLGVAGVLTSGAFGLTGLSSLSWVVSYFRGSMPSQLDQARKRMQDLAVYTGQKTKEVGQTIQSKAQEVGGAKEGERAGREGGK